MKSLLRTKVGRFTLEKTYRLAELQQLKEEGRLAETVLPVEAVFAEYPEIRVPEGPMDKLVCNGNPFHWNDKEILRQGNEVRVYRADGQFVGVYAYRPEKCMFYPKKIFLGQ